MKKKCIHIIHDDKFTKGYIDFLSKNNFNWDHIVFSYGNIVEPIDTPSLKVILVKDCYEIYKIYKSLLLECDRVIFSGFFDKSARLFYMPKNIWSKTYIQFWGGDIYRFKQRKNDFISNLKLQIMKNIVRNCIVKCNKVLLMVDHDYDVLKSIFNINSKSYYILQVPADFYEINHIDFSNIINNYNEKPAKYCILVGNSATIENQHKEIFDILKDKITDDFKIIVPLSYGDENYKQEIIKYGEKCFGNSFMPILKYLTIEEYVGLLSCCDVALFNNNRQQAMGNIVLLANLKKKIYIRNDTSLWNYYKELGLIFNDINTLKKETLNEILMTNTQNVNNNIECLRKLEKLSFSQWENFFNN